MLRISLFRCGCAVAVNLSLPSCDGGIVIECEVMGTKTLVTAEELFEQPDDGRRYELVSGELRMMSPSGWRHGEVVGSLHTLLGYHVRKNQLGKVFGAETGFRLSRDPDTVRAPDVAFIAKENLPEHDPQEAFWPGAPDLAVEVLSPSDTTGHVDEKIDAWLSAGVPLVWVVDLGLRTVTVYRSRTDIGVQPSGTRLDGADVVAGFSCAVDEIFTS